MDRSTQKHGLALPRPQGRLGVLRRRLEELRPLEHQELRASSEMVLASDSDRRAAAVAKANVETYRYQAYQAYLRTQAR